MYIKFNAIGKEKDPRYQQSVHRRKGLRIRLTNDTEQIRLFISRKFCTRPAYVRLRTKWGNMAV